MNIRVFLAALTVFLLTTPRLELASACAPAPHHNEKVAIADESAIIVWDAASQTEHFIRRASFDSTARDFGFLVPTPTQPQLDEASHEAFSFLATLTAPKIEKRKKESSGSGCCSCGCMGSKDTRGVNSSVRVLEEKRVAGYDAVVLEADDARSLGDWLKKHEYEFSNALVAWVKTYVDAKWKISAFKIAKDDAGTSRVGSSAVRMTFRTDRPFFPYREPAQPPMHVPNYSSPPRLLRVFFVGEGRVEGTMGASKQAWPGHVAWSGPIQDSARSRLLDLMKLPADSPPATWRLTEFEDHSSPRPGTDDVYFSKSEDQSPVERPPQVEYVSNNTSGNAVSTAALACLVGGFISFLRRRAWRRGFLASPDAP